jgi:hypothetical protein
MVEHDRDAESLRDPGKAADAAKMVQRDFTALLRVLDKQLASLSAGESDRRSHIAEARIAAKRGLKLSEQLIEILDSGGAD